MSAFECWLRGKEDIFMDTWGVQNIRKYTEDEAKRFMKSSQESVSFRIRISSHNFGNKCSPSFSSDKLEVIWHILRSLSKLAAGQWCWWHYEQCHHGCWPSVKKMIVFIWYSLYIYLHFVMDVQAGYDRYIQDAPSLLHWLPWQVTSGW